MWFRKTAVLRFSMYLAGMQSTLQVFPQDARFLVPRLCLRDARLGSSYSAQRRALTKLSYYHNPGKQRLFPCTLGDVIDRTAEKRGDNLAIVSCHQSIRKTYAEYKQDIDNFAAALISLKLGVGSKMAIIAPNMYEWAVVLFASAKAGLVLVSVNTAYQITELEYCLNHTNCEAVIFSEQFSKQDYYQMLVKLAPELKMCSPGELKSSSYRMPAERCLCAHFCS